MRQQADRYQKRQAEQELPDFRRGRESLKPDDVRGGKAKAEDSAIDDELIGSSE